MDFLEWLNYNGQDISDETNLDDLEKAWNAAYEAGYKHGLNENHKDDYDI